MTEAAEAEYAYDKYFSMYALAEAVPFTGRFVLRPGKHCPSFSAATVAKAHDEVSLRVAIMEVPVQLRTLCLGHCRACCCPRAKARAAGVEAALISEADMRLRREPRAPVLRHSTCEEGQITK